MERRRAFTMMELGIALATVGIFGLVAYPRFERSVDRASVRTARYHVLDYLTRARSAAIVHGREAVFAHTDGEIAIVVADSNGTPITLAPKRDLTGDHHVQVAATHDTLRFDAQGYARTPGTVTVIRLTGRVVSDSVCVPPSGELSERGCHATSSNARR